MEEHRELGARVHLELPIDALDLIGDGSRRRASGLGDLRRRCSGQHQLDDPAFGGGQLRWKRELLSDGKAEDDEGVLATPDLDSCEAAGWCRKTHSSELPRQLRPMTKTELSQSGREVLCDRARG